MGAVVEHKERELHASQYNHMAQALERYLPKDRHLDVLELGSATSPNQVITHRTLFKDIDHSYFGVDIRDGNNVDAVMPAPYTIPAKSKSADVVVAGSVFEHVPMPWASILEVARVLRPRGLFFFTAPSRGHKHTPVDCWRYYPDAVRALAAASRLTLKDVHTHYPPFTEDRRHDYGNIDAANDYWGDTVAVFQKPTKYAPTMTFVRPVVRWWANRASRQGPLGATPDPKFRCSVYKGDGEKPWDKVLRESKRAAADKVGAEK
ncbi:class I SAM-dependent methyltransferase [Actinocatenispora rupis]|uniref:class I SAM-dependent methyltransferase n=1 Tax=Actinocatenispora rupis TaxID=519421 RepID=UPI001944F29A|nr:methyltransferase domain-containing protein [Actinocatenispora rupis]